MRANVKTHKRKSRNKVSVVRNHSRKINKAKKRDWLKRESKNMGWNGDKEGDHIAALRDVLKSEGNIYKGKQGNLTDIKDAAKKKLIYIEMNGEKQIFILKKKREI